MAALRRVVRLGDGWQPAGITPDVMQHKMDQLRGLMDDAGRDWSELEITAMAPASARPEIAQVFEKMGVNVLYGLVSAADTETPKLFSEIKQFAAAMSGRRP